MRGLRIFLALTLVLTGLGAGLWLARGPIAGHLIRSAMTAQGLENPSVTVKTLGLSHLRLENIKADGLAVDFVAVDYAPGEVIKRRRVSAVHVGPARLKANVDDAGDISIAGMKGGGGNSGAGLPFDKLTLDGADIDIRVPLSSATAHLSANFDTAGEGEAVLSISSPDVRYGDYHGESVRGDATLQLLADGQFNATASLSGDINSPYGRVRDIDLAASGGGASWKDAARDGWRAVKATLNMSLNRATLDAAGASLVTSLNKNAALIGGPLSALSFSGEAALTLDHGDLYLDIGEAPFIVSGDSGARVSLDALFDEPLAMVRDGKTALAAALTVRGGAIDAGVNFSAAQADGGWRFRAPFRLGALSAEALALSDVSAVASGSVSASDADIDVTAAGRIDRAHIGRFMIDNAPMGASVNVAVDIVKRRATLTFPDGCARLDHIGVVLEGQDTEAALGDARLCQGVTPLAVIDFADAPVTDFAANVAAENARYRLGQTRFAGVPPVIDMAGRYEPVLNKTVAAGTAKGGSIRLNELVRFDRGDAALSFSLDKNVMTIGAKASRVRVSLIGDDPNVAPISVAGEVQLKGEEADFSYVAATPGGSKLGSGEGRHNIQSGIGAAAFEFDRISFRPEGIQPEDLAPVLKGIIGVSAGAMDGVAQFDWDRNEVRSKGKINLDNFTFQGPGLTVTKTVGVSGVVALKNLWPVATDGAQSITVKGVDFGALQLEDGEIKFEMPGDDTLTVERALFPWFGGVIGVRNATATFTGGEATAPLRVESVDLAQVLEFVDVEGLSGAGVLNGGLPLQVENGKAKIVGGRLTAEGPGYLSYVGKAADAAAQSGEARIAFDILRDLRYETLEVLVDGPLDGRLDFRIRLEGSGVVSVDAAAGRATGRVPVKYNINLDAALLELLNQANLTRDISLQYENRENQAEP